MRKVAAEFERACAAGEIETGAERKAREAREAAERAKLKTVRQYVERVRQCETLSRPKGNDLCFRLSFRRGERAKSDACKLDLQANFIYLITVTCDFPRKFHGMA